MKKRILNICLLYLLLLLHIGKINGNPIKTTDSVLSKRYFLSLNIRAVGGVNHITKEQYSFFIFTKEIGYWHKPYLLSGISTSIAFFKSNFGLKQAYIPYQISVFNKYFPFKLKGFKWIGIHSQISLSNSCMELLSPKREIYIAPGAGPTIHASIKKFAFNFTFPFYPRYFSRCENFEFRILRLKSDVRPYLGISYSF